MSCMMLYKWRATVALQEKEEEENSTPVSPETNHKNPKQEYAGVAVVTIYIHGIV